MDTTSPNPSPKEVLCRIDHSLLAPTATERQLTELCEIAAHLEVASVCLLPYFVETASKILDGTPVLVSTVVAFPHGAESTAAKVRAARAALSEGARELDCVINLSRVLSGEFSAVEREIHALTETCHQDGARIKVIFENCYLDHSSKVRLCELCSSAAVDWVKTSTGFGRPEQGPSGATPEDVALMRSLCPPEVGVKASGGIKTLADAMKFLALGASRIGTSNTAAIARELGVR